MGEREREHDALGGRVVAVAGAGGPAGRAVMARLAADGAVVVGAGRDRQRLDRAVEEAQAGSPGSVYGEVVDLTDAAATEAWAEDIERKHGRIDGLVHLVGGWRGGRDLTPAALDDWAALEGPLLRTVQHTTLAFREALARSGSGRFALVSATSVAEPGAGNAGYAAAKAAAETWVLALADSFAKAAAAAGGTGSDAPAGEPAGQAGAAAILVVKALVSREMRAERPEAKFTGFTDTDDLAGHVAALWTRPASELNGQRIWLTRP